MPYMIGLCRNAKSTNLLRFFIMSAAWQDMGLLWQDFGVLSLSRPITEHAPLDLHPDSSIDLLKAAKSHLIDDPPTLP